MNRILFAGDVMLGRGVNEALAGVSPDKPWGDLLPIFRQVNLSIVNLECALTLHPIPWTKTPKIFHFRADPERVEVLRAAGIRACVLANNHALDANVEGLVEMMDRLSLSGISFAGVGENLEEARRPKILKTDGREPLRVALISATDNEPAFCAGKDQPGTNYLPCDLDAATLDYVGDAVAQARQSGADIVVFSYHCGPNMVSKPSSAVRRFAQAVIDRGVDVYYGHSAHVFQGVEIYRGKPILFDTGDLLDDYIVDPLMRNDRSFLFVASFEGAEFCGIELVPVRLSYARVDLAKGEELEEIMKRMIHASGELGTHLERVGDRLVASGSGLRPRLRAA